MTEKIQQSSLKNAKFENMTAEQVIKKYEEVLYSRERQIFELSSEIGQINKKMQKMKAKCDNSKEKNIKLKNILQKKEVLLKQELDNKELMFMQLTKKEKECDEIQQKIKDMKDNKKIEKKEEIKSENIENIKNEENKEINEEKKEEIKKEKENEADLKLLAKEKINQLTNKGEGMKKINFAELLKKKQEKTQENNQNQEKKNDTNDKNDKNKRKIKHDLMEQRHQQIKNKNINPIKFSKYPINQAPFEMAKNNLLTEKDKDESDFVTIHFKDPYKTAHNFQFGSYKIEIDDKKLFLDAYKKVLIKEEKNSRKNRNNRNRKWFEYRFHHPGVYREFKYKMGGEQPKEEKFMAWSCCNNTNKNAKGCQKIKIDKHKWNFDSV